MKNRTESKRVLYSPPSFFFGDTRSPSVNKVLDALRVLVLGAAVLCCLIFAVWFLVIFVTL